MRHQITIAMVVDVGWIGVKCKCDWACENRAYLHKLHMFRKWYFSWSVLMIFMFCKLFLLSYWFVNKAWRFNCHSFCTSKDIVSWISKIRLNFVCRYALFSQAQSQIMGAVMLYNPIHNILLVVIHSSKNIMEKVNCFAVIFDLI